MSQESEISETEPTQRVLPVTFQLSSGTDISSQRNLQGPFSWEGREKVVFTSDAVDFTDVVRNFQRITIEELIDRQRKIRCDSVESVRVVEYKNSGVRAHDYRSVGQLHPDLTTARRLETIDSGACLGLAYILVAKSGVIGGDTVGVRLRNLYEKYPSLASDTQQKYLRFGFFRLANAAVIEHLLDSGALESSDLHDYFNCISEWQLCLALKRDDSTYARYADPYAYASDLTPHMGWDSITTDVRYIPYMFKVHMDYINTLYNSLDRDTRIRPSMIIGGVRQLYDFASRVIARYEPSISDEVARKNVILTIGVAEQYNNRFLIMARKFKERIAEYEKLKPRPEGEEGQGKVYGVEVRRDEVKSAGGKGLSAGVASDFDLRKEAKGDE